MDLIEDWIDHLRRQGRSEKTLRAHRLGVTHLADWYRHSYGQPFDPAELVRRDVVDWKAHQQTVGKAAPATVNQRLVAVSGFFEWAVSNGHAARNPAAAVRGIALPARRPKALDGRQLRRLGRQVERAGSERDLALVELLVGTGLRVSEALGLQMGDVRMTERNGEVIVRMGKKGNYRRVPLTASVRSALRVYLATLDAPPGNDDLLWRGQRGSLVSPSSVFKLLRNYARQAGLEEELVSPHVLRHTFATRYLAANPGDLRGLAAILGHRSLDTVMVYTEPTAEDLTARMARAETGRPEDE